MQAMNAAVTSPRCSGGAMSFSSSCAFLNAQEELNDIAPPEHRGEVTAAFIACIYFLVASAVIATGLLDLRLSLSFSVGAVALVLVAAALAGAAWQSASLDSPRAEHPD